MSASPALRILSASGMAPLAGEDICAAAGLVVRPGVHRPAFTDQVWDFTVVDNLPAYVKPHALRWDFTRINNPPWQTVAKEYLFALLAPRHELVRVLPRAYRTPRTLLTCAARLARLTGWLNWLTGQGLTCLAEVTQRHCLAYLHESSHRRDTGGHQVVALTPSGQREYVAALVDLAHYGELFSTDRYANGFRPWSGARPATIVGYNPTGENKTQPARQELLQPLLAAALHVVEVLGPHIVALRGEVADRTVGRPAHGRPAETVPAGIEAVLNQAVARGRPLERLNDYKMLQRQAQGWSVEDPLLAVSLLAIARDAGIADFNPAWLAKLRPTIETTLARVGAQPRWGRRAAPVPMATGDGQVPWTLPVHTRTVHDLVELARTACILVVAAITGMRASEIMELPAGCRLPPATMAPGLVRYKLAGKTIKGQPQGGTWDEWVVIEEVHRAVGLAEQLGPRRGGRLFGAVGFDNRYLTFRCFVNGPEGQRLGLAPIPEDVVNLRILRRTLAIELAYRPGGLLAAKIALKHVSVATTEGYSARPGGSQAKLLAEVGEHEQERNLDLILTEFRKYQNGVMPAGPGAGDLVEFFHTIDGELTDHTRAAAKLAGGDQEVRNLLTRRAQTLHLGTANYCWFIDPAKALCLKLAGTPTADRPLAGMCDSTRCPQATHHPCHRPVWAEQAHTLTVFIGGLSRRQTAERRRLETELARVNNVIAGIDTATGTTPTGEDHSR